MKIIKIIKIILLVLPIVGLISCVKQKNCDEGLIGTLQYLEEPIYVKPYCQYKESKVVAIFEEYTYLVTPIPKKYQSKTPIKVKILIKDEHNGGTFGDCPITYKLKCIEKVD